MGAGVGASVNVEGKGAETKGILLRPAVEVVAMVSPNPKVKPRAQIGRAHV